MARHEHTHEVFDSIADGLLDGAKTLKSIAATMRESGIPHVLIHGSASKNLYLPAVLDWIEKTNAEVKMQIRAYLTGVQSKAELQKQKNANQKLAAAKKPWMKKATKKPNG